MSILAVITILLFVYLLGSIPTALWVGKKYFKTDIRNYGSKNAGATNTFRVLGKKPGVIVMAIDTIKGYAGTSLIFLLPLLGNSLGLDMFYWKLIFGLVTVTGHIFPVFAGFKGGKGVATSLGMVIALHPLAALICFLVFTMVFLLFRVVSLGSMIAAITFPLIMFFPQIGTEEPAMKIFAIIACLIVIFTHKSNIKRLLRGEEKKIAF